MLARALGSSGGVTAHLESKTQLGSPDLLESSQHVGKQERSKAWQQDQGQKQLYFNNLFI